MCPEHGAKVPDTEIVFRLGELDSEGKVSVGWFTLSSSDKLEDPPSLSVYAESLTTHEQGAMMLGKGSYNGVGRLLCADIRQIIPTCTLDPKPMLEVLHQPLDTGEPGCEGHCGLIGLKLENGTQNKKEIEKDFRSKLYHIAKALAI